MKELLYSILISFTFSLLAMHQPHPQMEAEKTIGQLTRECRNKRDLLANLLVNIKVTTDQNEKGKMIRDAQRQMSIVESDSRYLKLLSDKYLATQKKWDYCEDQLKKGQVELDALRSQFLLDSHDDSFPSLDTITPQELEVYFQRTATVSSQEKFGGLSIIIRNTEESRVVCPEFDGWW